MKHHILKVLPTLLFVVLMIGCDSIGTNESLTSSVENQLHLSLSLPDVEHGRLKFESIKDFNEFVDYLIDQQSSLDLDEIAGNIDNFISLRTKAGNLMSDTVNNHMSENQSVFRIVEDPIFEFVLNQYGEVQIADSIFKVTHNFVYGISNTNSTLLSGIHLNSLSKQPLGEEVKIFEIQRSTSNNEFSTSNSVSKIQGRGECWADFGVREGPNRKYRLKGSLWIINWWIYRSFGSELESQQIRKRGWVRRWFHLSVQEVRLNGTFSKILNDSNGQRFTANENFNFVKYNAAEIRHTFSRDRGDILGANIRANFYARKSGYSDSASCSSTRSWLW